MSDDNAGDRGQTNDLEFVADGSGVEGLRPLIQVIGDAGLRQLIDELARAEAHIARVGSKEEWVENWDNPAEFKAFENEGGCFGSGSRITIEREDDSGLRLLIEDSSGDYAQITLSAEQVAALRLWLVE